MRKWIGPLPFKGAKVDEASGKVGDLLRFVVPFMLLLSFFNFAQAAEFQLIANSSIEEQELSKNDVRQILLINRTTWKDGAKIVLVAFSPEAKEAEQLALELMNMTALQAKKYWLTKVFSGVISALPFTEESAQEIVERVTKTKGAFAVLPSGVATGTAKKIRLQ